MGNPIPSSDARPMAWLYCSDDGSQELLLDCNGDHARRLIELGWTEQPLFGALPTEAQIRADAYEQAASYIEGKGGVIPGAAVFASLVSGNNQPCMSGDPRDRLRTHTRRQFDDATHSLAAAIRDLSDQPDSTDEGLAELLREQVADKVCLDVCELPDRTSPDDWPEALLVTSEELHQIVCEAIDTALSTGRQA